MSRIAIVLMREEIKEILPTLFFEVMQRFGEHYGDDVPITEMNGKLTKEFWEVFNDYFEERFMETLIGDVSDVEENEKLKALTDHLIEEGYITPEMVEGIRLITKNGLLVIEMIK